jgi:hypothetical protein
MYSKGKGKIMLDFTPSYIAMATAKDTQTKLKHWQPDPNITPEE